MLPFSVPSARLGGVFDERCPKWLLASLLIAEKANVDLPDGLALRSSVNIRQATG
jgi:hypothetical protein